MKVTAVVPVKLNSQRLPNKNIMRFTGGEPLCHYIIATLLSVPAIQEVYVYCSSPRIMNYVPDGAKFLRRSEALDQDSTKMNQVLINFAEDVESDIYVMAHTTAPFVKRESIAQGIKMVIEHGYDSAFSAKKLQDFLWNESGPFNYNLECIPRTQDLPVLYQETSGFYIYRKEVIEKGRRIGNRPYVVETGEIESIDIDEREEFFIADAVYNLMRNKGGFVNAGN